MLNFRAGLMLWTHGDRTVSLLTILYYNKKIRKAESMERTGVSPNSHGGPWSWPISSKSFPWVPTLSYGSYNFKEMRWGDCGTPFQLFEPSPSTSLFSSADVMVMMDKCGPLEQICDDDTGSPISSYMGHTMSLFFLFKIRNWWSSTIRIL